jgi:hypothetical protein
MRYVNTAMQRVLQRAARYVETGEFQITVLGVSPEKVRKGFALQDADDEKSLPLEEDGQVPDGAEERE